ncbi:TPA: ead/Ea22-like family protein [Klebsiella pneumoniae]|nr:ead/Ea22-like family protein [Klebsiella pneumoniae]
MTDITELAQSLKAAAEKATQGNWRAFQYHDGRCGIGGGHHDEIMVCEHISKERPHDAMFIALANPANVLALVEALEKAQQSIDSQREYYEGVIADGGNRIAELESRTVKLPEPFKLAKSSSGLRYYYADEVDAALTAAGIKVEAE